MSRLRRFLPLALIALLLGLFALPALAQPMGPAIDAAVRQDYSPVIRTFVLLSLLSILPVMLIGLTSFTRIIIVLSLLRHALGLPQTPPNSVLVTLAIFLTMFSMGPVIDKVNADSVQPYLQEKITATQALANGAGPVRDFMHNPSAEEAAAAAAAAAEQAAEAAKLKPGQKPKALPKPPAGVD